MPSTLRSFLSVSVLSLLLAACTVTFVPDDGGSGIVERPRPPAPSEPIVERPTPNLPSSNVIDRFETASNRINVGSVLAFRTRIREEGFLTITAMAPDGRVVVLMRATRVAANQQVFLPSGGNLQATTPRGTWRVRAHFTANRPAGVSFQGLQGERAWTEAILRDIEGAGLADVEETNYDVD